MKLKYYLKGFGVGVLFAAIVLSVAFFARSSSVVMTDEEVIARARVLGMEMASAQKESQVSDRQETEAQSEASEQEKASEEQTTAETEAVTEKETSTEETETAAQQESQVSDRQETEAQSEASEQEKASDEQTTAETETVTEEETSTEETETAAQQETITVMSREPISFEIESGMTAEAVAELLYEKGIISDAGALSAYLVEKGYDVHVHAGSYEIVPTVSYDEIIHLICPP